MVIFSGNQSLQYRHLANTRLKIKSWILIRYFNNILILSSNLLYLERTLLFYDGNLGNTIWNYSSNYSTFQFFQFNEFIFWELFFTLYEWLPYFLLNLPLWRRRFWFWGAKEPHYPPPRPPTNFKTLEHILVSFAVPNKSTKKFHAQNNYTVTEIEFDSDSQHIT